MSPESSMGSGSLSGRSQSLKRKRDASIDIESAGLQDGLPPADGFKPPLGNAGLEPISTAAVDVSTTSSSSTPQVSVFEKASSIVLVGMSGAGKKTLGVIASVALQRRYVDFRVFFENRVGVSPAQYLVKHGLVSYRQAEQEITDALLKECQQNHVIGGLGDMGGNSQRALLKAFTKSNPVIYIHRAKEELRAFMDPGEGKFDQWYDYRKAFYRSCSNFDFYNMSFTPRDDSVSSATNTLKLKGTETQFIHFVRRLFGAPPQLLHSSDPFSPSYTYALQVPLTWLQTHQEYKELECGADVVNLVVKLSDEPEELQDDIVQQMAILRRHTRAPIIFETQYSTTASSAYFKLLRLAARTLPDAIAVDLSAEPSQISYLIPALGSLNTIGTYHRVESWQESGGQHSLLELQDIARTISCKALRISHTPNASSDNLDCVQFVRVASRNSDISLGAYNIGPLGRSSVCFNPVLSPVALPSMSNNGVTVRQAQSALYSCFFLPRKTFTIFGKSVSYSLSPVMHNAAYEACGMPHHYRFLESNDFSRVHDLFEEEDCGGVVFSLPFKTDILPLLHSVSPEVMTIGAVNTVVLDRERNSDGTQHMLLKGFNTDHVGIRECIYRHLSPANSIREGTSALILGAGGMARATVFAYQTLGVKQICLYSRTFENAQTLARHYAQSGLNICVLRSLDQEWPANIRQPTIIVSAIPAHGIDGHPGHELKIPDQWLRSRTGGVFIELAYKPIVTRLITQMRSMQHKGWIIVDGLSVLVEQGIAQFEILTGRPAPVHVMRLAVQKYHQSAGLQDGTSSS